MAQSYNLGDVYAIQFGQIMSGLLSRNDFPASRMSLSEILDAVEPLALAATRRIADTVGDMSTAVPPVTDYDAGYNLGSSLYVVPQDAAPPAPYIRPTTVLTPGGDRIAYVDRTLNPAQE